MVWRRHKCYHGQRKGHECLKAVEQIVKHSLYYCWLQKAILAVNLKQAAHFRLSH